MMIRITPQIAISDDEIRETFIRASGPGGQNVNKVSTAVQLRFDIQGNQSLPVTMKQRLIRMAGRSVTRHGILIISADNARSRELNRGIARKKLLALLRRAALEPKPHQKTRIPYSSRLQRLDSKRRRATLKTTRRSLPESEA